MVDKKKAIRVYGNAVCPAPKCGLTFPMTRKWQRFCNTQCRNDYHNYIRLSRNLPARTNGV